MVIKIAANMIALVIYSNKLINIFKWRTIAESQQTSSPLYGLFDFNKIQCLT